MANTLILKRRIKTAQNVSKTTRAMQMIAASKFKRAQNSTLASRPYVEKLTTINKTLAGKLEEKYTHPYMKQEKTTEKTLLLVFSPDKGLCGGLITNLLKEYLKVNSENFILLTVGKKAEKEILSLGKELVASLPFGNTLPPFNMVYPISKIIDDYFLNKKVNTVKILYTHFASIFIQKPTLTTILPLALPEESSKDLSPSFELFEPSAPEILPSLLRHYLEMVLYQYLLESYACEQASRMIAMQNATDNANEIIGELTLEYNKARQTKITNEILDISSASLFNYAE